MVHCLVLHSGTATGPLRARLTERLTALQTGFLRAVQMDFQKELATAVLTAPHSSAWP